MRILDEDQKQHLTKMSEKTDVEHDVRLRYETAAVIERVANRIHRVRNNRENPIERQVLIHQEKEIAPICFRNINLIFTNNQVNFAKIACTYTKQSLLQLGMHLLLPTR